MNTLTKSETSVSNKVVIRLRTKKSVRFAEKLATFRPFDIHNAPSTINGALPMTMTLSPPHDCSRGISTSNVILQSAKLISNKIEGVVLVKKISDSKRVTIHYTFDGWKFSLQKDGEYLRPMYNSTEDQDLFTFSLTLPSELQFSTKLDSNYLIQFFICCQIPGHKIWDDSPTYNHQAIITPNIQTDMSDYEWSLVNGSTISPKLLSGLCQLSTSRCSNTYLDNKRGTVLDGLVDNNGFTVSRPTQISIPLYSPPTSNNFGGVNCSAKSKYITMDIKPITPVHIPRSTPSRQSKSTSSKAISTYIPFFDMPCAPVVATTNNKVDLSQEQKVPTSFFDRIPLNGSLPRSIINQFDCY